jgi:hypothetical protein
MFIPDPGSKRFRIPIKDFPDPGSRSQKGTGSRIWIRNTVQKYEKKLLVVAEYGRMKSLKI